MSLQENKALVRRFIEEVLNTGDMASANDFLADSYAEHSAPPGLPGNREGVKAVFAALHQAFPDFRYTVEDMIAEGEMVVCRLTASGTMRGPFFGLRPTGRHAVWSEIHIVRLRDGKAIEHWDAKETLARNQQLGLAPQGG